MISKQIKVISETGIHSRPAISIVNVANQFKSSSSIKYKEQMVDLKSIMGVMSLGIYNNEVITISCMGEDEQKAIIAIEKVIIDLKLGKVIEE